MVKRRVLMIAYHFPPMRGSSGLQRTLKFSRYLPEHAWEPMVLSAHPRAYTDTSTDQIEEIAPNILVKRAFAFDTARHFAIRGSYPGWLALPDRWVSWWLGGVVSGLKMIRQYRPQVIWSTYPIATAHLIGLTLHRMTGVPWVADFRDSMTEENYPNDLRVRKWYRWIERHAVENCRYAVFTTPGAARMYQQRYSNLPSARWQMIANGYDEENFSEAESTIQNVRRENGPVILVHSGVLYPKERDPRVFFAALGEMRRNNMISASSVKVILRASGHDDYYGKLLQENAIQDIVMLAPAISYRAALAEMLAADGLLIFQAASCNHQIPAKIYEYLRARRPIFALTDPAGDTAGVLKQAGVDTIVPLDSKERIMAGLIDFLARAKNGHAPLPSVSEIARHSRRAQSAELAGLLSTLVGARQD